MKRQAGFTIIELLIVVTILAMLAGILVPVLEDSASSARDARRAADLKTVQSALEAFKRVNGTYPATGGAWATDETALAADYGPGGYIPGLVPNFMQTLPRDPDPQYPTATAHYRYRSDGNDYKFSINGTPESYPAGNPFADPANATGWMVCSPGGYNW